MYNHMIHNENSSVDFSKIGSHVISSGLRFVIRGRNRTKHVRHFDDAVLAGLEGWYCCYLRKGQWLFDV